MKALALAAALLASGAQQANWREVATPADRARLREWRTAWMAALAATPRPAADPLFDPDRAIAEPMPPTGAYRCRVIRFDAPGPAAPVRCRVDGQDFAITAGPYRPRGQVFPDSASRAVLLGTLLVGDEKRPIRYGRDERRDVAGLMERVGSARWRIVLPYPRFGGTLDLIELSPAQ